MGNWVPNVSTALSKAITLYTLTVEAAISNVYPFDPNVVAGAGGTLWAACIKAGAKVVNAVCVAPGGAHLKTPDWV